MRTRATRTPAAKETPRKENVSLQEATLGAKKAASKLFAASKNWREVVVTRSTSEKTTPKPLTDAGMDVPGTKNVTSMMVLPIGVKSRSAEKGAKEFG